MKLALALCLLTLFCVAEAPIKPRVADATIKPPVPPSKYVAVHFAERMKPFTVEDMLKLPQVTVQVHDAHRNTEETYSGPLLAEFLAQLGLEASRDTEPLILHSSVVATGSDQYFVVYSLAEIEPTFSTG